jgi:hypothetical protein
LNHLTVPLIRSDMFASYGNEKIWRVLYVVLHRSRLNGEKQSGSRMIREPTWYFQSKLLVSYGA